MKASLPTHSFLEEGSFPSAALADIALREGRRPRPIYTAHKWFARRLPSVFRALLVGATSPNDVDFWSSYYDANLEDLTVLDPFVGGGTSVVEAKKLGAKTIGVDVDPVACAVSELELSADRLPVLDESLETLQKTLGRKLERFYQYSDGHKTYKVLHFFWVQVVSCDGCGILYDVHPNYALSKMDDVQWVFCSKCGEIHKRKSGHKSFKCSSCGSRTTIEDGNVEYGKACCPECSHQQRLIDIGRKSKAPPNWKLFALEVLSAADGGRPVPIEKRHFVKANEDSLKRYHLAERALKRRLKTHPDTFPPELIKQENRNDDRLLAYGYRNWIDLFNARQLLHLSHLLEAIKQFEDSIQKALAMAISDHLTSNCMFASYASGWRRLSPLFSIRAFRHIPRPVELNPWMDGTGRGTFPNAVRKMNRARKYAISPTEPKLKGGFEIVKNHGVEQKNIILNQSSCNLSSIDSNSVDIVLTDPPYFDNIAYSELSEFFVPWLKCSGIIQSNTNVKNIVFESLVGNRNDHDTLRSYTERLGLVIGEITRVLKHSGLLVFSYRHILPNAWLALAEAIGKHRLVSTRVLPVPGEAGSSLQTHNGTGLWDAVFVFRKTSKTNSRNFNINQEDIERVSRSLKSWKKTLEKSSLPFRDVDAETLRRGLLIDSVLRHKTKHSAADGEPLLHALQQNWGG